MPHTPGDSANQFIITNSGSYYLTGNVTGVSGKNGISVNANNVIINLNGYTLVGTAGSLSGLIISGSHANIAIHNGVAVGWGGKGIDAGNATNEEFTHLLLSSNGADGITVGSNARIRDLYGLGQSNRDSCHGHRNPRGRQ